MKKLVLILFLLPSLAQAQFWPPAAGGGGTATGGDGDFTGKTVQADALNLKGAAITSSKEINIEASIKQPDDSTAHTGHQIAKSLSVDSLGYVQGDTLQWKFMGWDEPEFQPGSPWSFCVYRFRILLNSANLTSAPISFRLVTDSANITQGYFGNVHIKTTNWNIYQSAWRSEYLWQRVLKWGGNEGMTPGWTIGTVTGSSTRAFITIAEGCPPAGIGEKQMGLRISGTTSEEVRGYIDIEATLTFRSSGGKPKRTSVTITDL